MLGCQHGQPGVPEQPSSSAHNIRDRTVNEPICIPLEFLCMLAEQHYLRARQGQGFPQFVHVCRLHDAVPCHKSAYNMHIRSRFMM